MFEVWSSQLSVTIYDYQESKKVGRSPLKDTARLTSLPALLLNLYLLYVFSDQYTLWECWFPDTSYLFFFSISEVYQFLLTKENEREIIWNTVSKPITRDKLCLVEELEGYMRLKNSLETEVGEQKTIEHSPLGFSA